MRERMYRMRTGELKEQDKRMREMTNLIQSQAWQIHQQETQILQMKAQKEAMGSFCTLLFLYKTSSTSPKKRTNLASKPSAEALFCAIHALFAKQKNNENDHSTPQKQALKQQKHPLFEAKIEDIFPLLLHRKEFALEENTL